ncbi:hypothetical protein [Moorena sp. SIO3A2]|uniref:hypothetical protein n=1 Tax=Moorena sp. SIO3A2 TaxID=2607841 RepID=UPI0013B62426|nr:hypothetical protein [Moorena sp. SIO3A2]NER90059.1 hypothetical protein [Moorena sp. SIO3A2]
MSQTGSAETIGEDESYARCFFALKSLQRYMGQGFYARHFRGFQPRTAEGSDSYQGNPSGHSWPLLEQQKVLFGEVKKY